jgi:hypothetical protein
MVVAGLAIMNAGLLAFGNTIAAVIEKWRQ